MHYSLFLSLMSFNFIFNFFFLLYNNVLLIEVLKLARRQKSDVRVPLLDMQRSKNYYAHK